MNEKALMKKQRMRTLLIFIAILYILQFLSSCQSSEANKWTPPKFVKEWEIKEIKPGLPHEIISMTANKNGIFVLVKALETKYLPPKIANINEMTEEERKAFLHEYVTCLFTGSTIDRMTKEEKDEIIDFILKHFIPPREAEKMAEDEKKEIIGLVNRYREEKEPESNKKFFRERLQREGKDVIINDISKCIASIRRDREEIEHYRIQHYNFDGNFISQWPGENRLILPENLRENTKPIIVHRFFPYRQPAEIDSRDYLIKPAKIFSGDSGDIYMTEYEGNKIVNFDPSGAIKGLWRMLPTKHVEKGSIFKGLTINRKGHILVIGESELLITPRLYEYDQDGKLIKSEELESKIKAYTKLFRNALLPWLMRIERIVDMGVDNDGNIYLLMFKNITEKPTLVKLTPAWKEEREFKVILKEGFEAPRIKVYEKYFKGFDSTQWSWIETGPGFYFPSSIFSDGEYLYVTFLGLKPFGVIDAVIYDRKGKTVGYWKEESRSHMEWYRNLDPNIEVLDTNLSLTQYGSSIFVGRTMEIRTGAFYMKNIIQRFNK